MKRNIRSFTTLILIFACMVICSLCSMPIKVNAEENTIIKTWSFEEEGITADLYNDGCLMIDGSGSLPEWEDFQKVPWLKTSALQINSVIISSSISDISAYSFYECLNLCSVVLPQTINIVDSAFYGCENLVEIYYEGSNKNEWNTSVGESDHSWRTNATVYYKSNEYRDGCWHYVNNKPAVWTKEEGGTHTHVSSDWIIEQNSTCVKKGSQYKKCIECGVKLESQQIDLKSHTYKTEVISPNCTNDGYTKHTCTVCGDTFTDQTTNKLGHNYKTEVISPNCTNDGYTKHTCIVCGNSFNDQTTNKLGHDYKTEIISPDCINDGYTKHTCIACSDTYTDQITTKLGHDFGKDGTAEQCSRCQIKSGIHIHNVEKINGKAATTEEAGWKDYYHCKDCNKYFSDKECTNEIVNLESWIVGEGKIAKKVSIIALLNSLSSLLSNLANMLQVIFNIFKIFM